MTTHGLRRSLIAPLATALLAMGAAVATVVPLAAPAAHADAPAWVDDTSYDGTYYASVTPGETGAQLRATLHHIISTGVTTLNYASVYKDLAVTDADPANPADVIDFYTGEEMKFADCDGSCTGTNNSNNGLPDEWNREHTWAQSRGGFDTNNGPGTDIFAIRPELESCNSSRGNDWFDNGGTPDAKCPGATYTSTTFDPRADIRGDLARGLLYMAIRWEGDDGWDNLELNDDPTTFISSHSPSCTNGQCTTAYYGILSTLLEWNAEDPPSCAERARNQVVYSQFQHNRNPFIDHPEWVQDIWPQAPAPSVTVPDSCGSSSSSAAASTTASSSSSAGSSAPSSPVPSSASASVMSSSAVPSSVPSSAPSSAAPSSAGPSSSAPSTSPSLVVPSTTGSPQSSSPAPTSTASTTPSGTPSPVPLAKPAKLAVSVPAHPRARRPLHIRIRVTSAGRPATGRVVVRAASRIIGRPHLRAGRATVVIRWPRAGRLHLTVTYSGSATARPAVRRTSVVVRR